MTELKRKVSRVTTRTYRVARGRQLVVSLLPGDLISFREKGTRKEYEYPLEAVYVSAVQAEVNRVKKEKKAKKRGRGGF